MAKKVTETVTPNPLSPEQDEYNRQQIDANAVWVANANRAAPVLIDRLVSAGADDALVTEILRSTGLYSDQAATLARGGGPANKDTIAQLYTEILGRPADAGGLDYWTNTGQSIEQIAKSFEAVAAAGTDPLRPQGSTARTTAPGGNANGGPGPGLGGGGSVGITPTAPLPIGRQIMASGGGARTQAVRAIYANRNLPPPTAEDLRYWTGPEQGSLEQIESNIIAAAPNRQWASEAEQHAAYAAGEKPGPMSIYADKMFSGDELTAGGRQALDFMGYGDSPGLAGYTGTGGGTGGGGVGLAPQSAGGGGGAGGGGVGLAPQSFRSAPFDPMADYQLVANAADTAITAGQKDIDRFFGDAMKVLQEQATARGMRFADTPILDRGGQIATDVLRQKEDLAQGIRAQQASLNLSYPLEKYTTLSNVGVNEGRLGLDTRSLAQQAEQFNSEMGLRNRTLNADVAQRGIENRLASANALMDRYNSAVNAGLSLLNVTQPNQPIFPDPGSTATSRTSGISTSSLLGGGGALLEGLGAIGIKSLFSSARDTKNVLGGVWPEDILRGVARTPVSKWSYKGDSTGHIGPMAEDFQAAFGVGDGKTISIIDAIGVLFAAIQGLNQKVEGLQHAN